MKKIISYRTPIKNINPNVIYTMRHGESEGNARGIEDISLRDLANHEFRLTTLGINQVKSSASYVYKERLIKPNTGIYTSNFLRAKHSTEILLERQRGKSFQVTIDPRLDEWWKGIFHSLPLEEIKRNYPLELKIQRREGWYHYRPPQGQAGKDVEKNLISFLKEVDTEEMFIIGHGRNLGFMYRLLADQPISLQCNYPIPKNGEIWKFTKNPEINRYNFESIFTP